MRYEIKNGTLTIDGDEHIYIQDEFRDLWLCADQLSLYFNNFSYVEGETSRYEHIRGTARLDRGHHLGIAGSGIPPVKSLPFSIRSGGQGSISFGFTGVDWEGVVTDDKWFVEAGISEGAFNQLVDAWKSGRLGKITICCTTNLWLRDYDKYTEGTADWYLAPLPSQETAYGHVRHFGWSERLKDEREKEPARSESVASRSDHPKPDDTRAELEQQQTKVFAEIARALKIIGIALGAICVILLLK